MREQLNFISLSGKIEGKMAEESKLRVVVFGKTGTGKSSLINSLFLSKDSSVAVATEGHGLFSETKSVGCYTKMVTMIVNDVHVTLWDTPGLKDPRSDGEKTIKEIGDGCDIGDIDLFVYCTKVDQPRLEKDDFDCIRDITKAFGDGIWKRALFALTFANQVTLPPSVTDMNLSEYFPFRLEQWKEGLHLLVKEHARELSGQAISSIPVVPTGYKNLPLPDNRFWLLEFWYACVAQVKFFALPAMKRMADDQIKGEAERTAIAGEFEKRMAKEPESADKAQVARGLASLPGSANHGSTVTTSSVDSIDSPDGGPDENTCSTVTVEFTDNGLQGTATTIPLKEFRNSHPDYKAMQIVCNETFEKLVEKYLASSDKTLEEIKEKYMDEAFKGAKYFHSKVEIDVGSIKELDPIRKCIGDPVTFPNKTNVDGNKTFTQIIEYTTGTELTETVTSGWSITGGLSAEYQGVGASAGVGYTEQQSETIKQIKGMKERKDMTDTFLVKHKSSRRVTVIRTMQRKECQVRNVELSFPRDAKLKCKFRTKADSNKVEKKARFLIRDILDDCIENKGADPLTAKLEGKCVWVETDLELNVEPDKPLK